jgi:hypothetical protein
MALGIDFTAALLIGSFWASITLITLARRRSIRRFARPR